MLVTANPVFATGAPKDTWLRPFHNPAPTVYCANVQVALAPNRFAVTIEVADPAAAFRHASELKRAGRFDAAADICQQSLVVNPTHVDLLHLAGTIAMARNDPAASEQFLARARALKTGDLALHVNYGLTLMHAARPAEALSEFDAAISASPNSAVASFHRGNALRALGRRDEALEALRSALAGDPGLVEALINCAGVFHELGRDHEALDMADRALALAPGDVDALIARGAALFRLRRTAEAVSAFDAALARDPRSFAAALNRGHVFSDLGQFGRARESYASALAIRPDDITALKAAADVERHAGNFATAAEKYRTLVGIDSDCEDALGYLLHARLNLCDWRDFNALVSAVDSGIRRNRRVARPMAVAAAIDDPDLQAAAARLTTAEAPARPASRPHPPTSERVRIAYVSSDYWDHPVGRMVAGLFERHDRARFEVAAVSLSPAKGDAVESRLKAAAEHWFDVSDLSDADAATAIEHFGADVVVDLQGPTLGRRPGLLAFRPAPVQVAYLGFPGSAAHAAIDYLIADATVAPHDHDRLYREAIVRLPHCYHLADPTRHKPSRRAPRGAHDLPTDGVVFACFHSVYKLTPQVFDTHMRIVRAIEDSVLWLRSESATVQENLRREAAARGVTPNRLIFAKRLAEADHLERLSLADLSLDTLPYNGHSTTLDSLWAGVPVIAWQGRSFPARVSASMLAALGMSDFVAHTTEEYVNAAVTLARDQKRLDEARTRLQMAIADAPLFDIARSCRALEHAFGTMLDRTRRGLRPAPFDVRDPA